MGISAEWQGVKQANTPPYTHILTYLSSFFVSDVWAHSFSPKDHGKKAQLTWELRKDSLLLQSSQSQHLTSHLKKRKTHLSQSSKAQIRRKQSDTKPLEHPQFSLLLQSCWATCCLFVSCFFSSFFLEWRIFICSHFTLFTKQFPLPVSLYPLTYIS